MFPGLSSRKFAKMTSAFVATGALVLLPLAPAQAAPLPSTVSSSVVLEAPETVPVDPAVQAELDTLRSFADKIDAATQANWSARCKPALVPRPPLPPSLLLRAWGLAR